MSPTHELEQLDANIGTQFDKDVVAAMHEVVSKA